MWSPHPGAPLCLASLCLPGVRTVTQGECSWSSITRKTVDMSECNAMYVGIATAPGSFASDVNDHLFACVLRHMTDVQAMRKSRDRGGGDPDDHTYELGGAGIARFARSQRSELEYVWGDRLPHRHDLTDTFDFSITFAWRQRTTVAEQSVSLYTLICAEIAWNDLVWETKLGSWYERQDGWGEWDQIYVLPYDIPLHTTLVTRQQARSLCSLLCHGSPM
jgi:hypothetical protein